MPLLSGVCAALPWPRTGVTANEPVGSSEWSLTGPLSVVAFGSA